MGGDCPVTEDQEAQQIAQLTDGELTRGIGHYRAALAAHVSDAPIRTDIADLLSLYEQELGGRTGPYQ